VYAGFDVPVNYDPILGKLIVWGEDRAAACSRMIRALQESVILGVKTPVEFLLDVISSQAFQAGDTHTHFIEENFADWHPDKVADEPAALGFVANEMVGPKVAMHAGPVSETGEPPSPWQTLGPWDMAR